MQVPTLDEVDAMLNGLLGKLLLMFKVNNIDGLSVVSLGTILSKLNLGDPARPIQTQIEVNAIIREQAKVHLDTIKTTLLRASIGAVN